MIKCWEQKPNDRPTFADLTEQIAKVLEPLADYLDVSTFGALEPDETGVTGPNKGTVLSNPMVCESDEPFQTPSCPSEQPDSKGRVDKSENCIVLSNPLFCNSDEHTLSQSSPQDEVDATMVGESRKSIVLSTSVGSDPLEPGTQTP